MTQTRQFMDCPNCDHAALHEEVGRLRATISGLDIPHLNYRTHRWVTHQPTSPQVWHIARVGDNDFTLKVALCGIKALQLSIGKNRWHYEALSIPSQDLVCTGCRAVPNFSKED